MDLFVQFWGLNFPVISYVWQGQQSVLPSKGSLFSTNLSNTPGSELAKRLRGTENDLEKWTGYKLKIVEEAGDKF